MHIVLASIEKIVPTLEDCTSLLRVLARSATGQDFSVYTTFSTGARRPGDLDGPDEYHVVLVDNGRSAMLGTDFQEMLRCIRCAACMNHCPVYGAVGGHAYGWVYPGPMGSVLTPSLIGVDQAGHLPNASTFCGKCESVCPVKIPLPKLMRHWREREFERHLTPRGGAHQPGAVGLLRAPPVAVSPGDPRRRAGRSGLLGRKHGRFRKLPLAGGWTDGRDMPAPEGDTFFARYARAQRAGTSDEQAKRCLRRSVAGCVAAHCRADQATMLRGAAGDASAASDPGALAAAACRAGRAVRRQRGEGIRQRRACRGSRRGARGGGRRISRRRTCRPTS